MENKNLSWIAGGIALITAAGVVGKKAYDKYKEKSEQTEDSNTNSDETTAETTVDTSNKASKSEPVDESIKKEGLFNIEELFDAIDKSNEVETDTPEVVEIDLTDAKGVPTNIVIDKSVDSIEKEETLDVKENDAPIQNHEISPDTKKEDYVWDSFDDMNK